MSYRGLKMSYFCNYIKSGIDIFTSKLYLLQGNLNSTTSADSGTFGRRSNTLKHEFTP